MTKLFFLLALLVGTSHASKTPSSGISCLSSILRFNPATGTYTIAPTSVYSEGHYIHPWPTDRSLATLKDGSPVLIKKIEDAAKEGKSILSLGEGNSNLLFSIIIQRKKSKLETDNLIAVDFAYPQIDPHTGKIVDQRSPSEFEVDQERYNAESAKLVEALPQNYLYGRFQDMNLQSPEGTQRSFDLIYSAHAYTYVLNSISTEEQRGMILNTLRHLNSPGEFVIYPIFNLSHELKNILESLKSEGFIKNYEWNNNTSKLVLSN